MLTRLNHVAFDQMGVELGKVSLVFATSTLSRITDGYIDFSQVLAKAILPSLDGKKGVEGHDSSTTGLINYWLQHKL